MATPHEETAQTSDRRHRDRAARIAVEELTGLALQERGLIALLSRQAGEAPLGGPRERLERHLEQSRTHAARFDDRVRALRDHRGGGEYLAGMLRSGFAALGTVGATVAQAATAPLALLRRGGGEERLLENAGVEGAALANKIVILTAVSRALELSGDQASHALLAQTRDEARATWDELLEQTPELMTALVRARSQEPSYNFRTAGASDAAFDAMGPGHAGGTPPADGAGAQPASAATPASSPVSQAAAAAQAAASPTQAGDASGANGAQAPDSPGATAARTPRTRRTPPRPRAGAGGRSVAATSRAARPSAGRSSAGRGDGASSDAG